MVTGRTALWIWLLAAVLASPALGQQPKVWAVIVGISQFSKLPGNQQLEYAAKDAEAFAKFLSSPRGGGVPPENVTLLLNGEATGAAIKKRLGTTLRRNAKPEDVVYIFLATHGMVEKGPDKALFVLGSDAEPDDLYRSAITMKDLDNIISNRLENAGRIVLLADLSHSAGLAGVNALLQQAAAKRKELIGLMATRGAESSQGGPQFCGGHGAFTCALLKGLDGAADADNDKTVTPSELIDYVAEQLRKATDNKQHLQNFGSFENEIPLSFLDKPGPSDWKAFSPGPK